MYRLKYFCWKLNCKTTDRHNLQWWWKTANSKHQIREHFQLPSLTHELCFIKKFQFLYKKKHSVWIEGRIQHELRVLPEALHSIPALHDWNPLWIFPLQDQGKTNQDSTCKFRSQSYKN